ncbi:MAG: tRNA (adenosine(37)-N6)-threonylcarbamoyltransferase complex dimerization subunit type 1 TsaB [Erysipelotrichaceae bacterium]|nr:tRNA (adenosine(37)-N6)-threonylcarbamoyltransferase complex dimerization subunit type 1 TsaB [Erysipelotrichaceae bacterium]
MKVVGMDTSYKYLNIVLIENNEVIDSLHMECFKKQSEWMIPKLKMLLDQHGWDSKDIDAMVITDGPGSYTGIRIAMTVAKVFCSSMKIDLYTVSTLQLYAGSDAHTCAIMDARGQRVYVGQYHHGQVEWEDHIETIEQMRAYIQSHPEVTYVGDCGLFEMEERFDDIASHLLELKPYWHKVEQVDYLTPRYLKDTSEYLVKP